jgi:hypothetical protein
MSARQVLLIVVIASLLHACVPVNTAAEYGRLAMPEEKAKVKSFKERQEEIYAHMKRYGINRDDVVALRHLFEESPPYSKPHIGLPADKLLNPGEHYRIEMENEYILTMKVPQGDSSTGFFYPYNNIRDPEIQKELQWGNLKIAALSWYTDGPPSRFGGRSDTSGPYIDYRLIKPEEEEKFITPEKLLTYSTEVQKNQIKTPADVAEIARQNTINKWVPTWFEVKQERVVINGRVWIRDGTSDWSGRPYYYYRTVLRPGRVLLARFSLPRYNYPPNADPRAAASTYPEPIREAIARMDEMVASLRIAKIKDDGAPDPFVIERVKPAPLPVREPLPAAQPRQ